MMSPAFDSAKQSAAFALLLLFLLAAPWLTAKKILPPPNEAYASESIRWERFPWLQKFIYEETNDIDIAFVGSSRLGHGIDTPYVQQKLDERLGRKTVVRSIYFRGMGFDALYFVTRDLLAHRRVKTLVFYDEWGAESVTGVQPSAPLWFRYAEDGQELSGLPLEDRAVFYYASIVGLPRNLLEPLTPALPRDMNSTPISYPWKEPGPATDPESNLGCISTYLCYDAKKRIPLDPHFVSYLPQTSLTPRDILTYSPATASSFRFSNQPLDAVQIYFAKQFGLLVRSHGCQLVLIHLPKFAERTSPVITESRYWPDFLGTDVCMTGFPSAQLFAGLSESETARLFMDPVHLNANGQKYFTSLITPALLEFYATHFPR